MWQFVGLYTSKSALRPAGNRLSGPDFGRTALPGSHRNQASGRPEIGPPGRILAGLHREPPKSAQRSAGNRHSGPDFGRKATEISPPAGRKSAFRAGCVFSVIDFVVSDRVLICRHFCSIIYYQRPGHAALLCRLSHDFHKQGCRCGRRFRGRRHQ